MKIPVYSISKPFLAQAVLALELPLTQTIGHFVPNLADVYTNRRLYQLLNHSSGLGDYGSLPEYQTAVTNREPAWSRQELLHRSESLNHNHQGFRYSNIGYLLLRMAVERATGKSYFQSLEELVFAPLGISGLVEWEKITDVVPDYDPRWVYSGTFLAEPSAVAPALACLVAHRVAVGNLNDGHVEVPFPNTGFEHPGYSYGFMAPGNPATMVGHGGGGPGFGLMALVNVVTGAAELEYDSDTGWDQTAAILRLRAKLES